MIRVTIVPRVQSDRLVSGVTRYLFGILSYGDPESLDIDLRILHRGREMPAQEWVGRFPSLRQTANRAWRLDEMFLRPLALYRSRSAVIHYPLGLLPQSWMAGAAPRIVTLHGASLLTGSWHSAESISQGERFKKQLHAGLSKLARVITVSQWSKREVAKAYDLGSELIKVIPNGVDLGKFRILDNKVETQAWLQEKLGIRGAYLLYVGPCSPRKNTLRLVQAFGHLKQRYRIPHRLVLAGAPGQYFSTVESEVTRLGLTDKVVFAGPVGDDALIRLYNGASAFVFPSLYEGFGFPVVEAMACGTPVVTSNCTALPETVEGAAALVDDPTDIDNLVAVIQQVLEDAAYRETLRERGLVRAQAFTWEACAMAHLRLYRRVSEERGGKH